MKAVPAAESPPAPEAAEGAQRAAHGPMRRWLSERNRAWWFTLLGSWVAGRVLVTIGVFAAAQFADRVDTSQPNVLALRWWAWDASWYDRLTGEGWAVLGSEGYRFFPGYPLAAEPLATVFGPSAGSGHLPASPWRVSSRGGPPTTRRWRGG